MRLLSFVDDLGASWGMLEGESVRNLGRLAVTQDRSLAQVMRAGDLSRVLAAVEEAPVVALESVQLLPSLTDPQKILCVGLNYADHIAEMGRDTPQYPVVFTRYPDSLVGSETPLVASRKSSAFDYEGELALVIGKEARNVRAEDADSHIFGYSILNDGSMRDYQRHTHQFTPGKNFDESGSFGPLIVSADEFGDLGRKRITTALNGEVLQDSSLDQLIFKPADLVAYASSWTTLRPGDVIATGTPGGVGDGFSPPKYMVAGDEIVVTIEGIGELRNTVVAGE